MRAFKVSIFIMLFFFVLSIYTSFSEFSSIMPNKEVLRGENTSIYLSNERIQKDIKNMSLNAQKQLDKLQNDENIKDYFITFFYGAQAILFVIKSTLRYMLFVADILIMYGVPNLIAYFVQSLIYLSYVISLFEIFKIGK